MPSPADARGVLDALYTHQKVFSPECRRLMCSALFGEGGLSGPVLVQLVEVAVTRLNVQPEELNEIQRALPRTRSIYSPDPDSLGRDLDVNNPALLFFICHREPEAQNPKRVAWHH